MVKKAYINNESVEVVFVYYKYGENQALIQMQNGFFIEVSERILRYE